MDDNSNDEEKKSGKETKKEEKKRSRDIQSHETDSTGSDTSTDSHSPKRRKTGTSSGRWTSTEHQIFLKGLGQFGREWKRVAESIPTRTSAQVRSHAQKYFAKQNKQKQHESLDNSIHRILVDPGSVETEVRETLSRLHQRHRQLQQQILEQQRQRPSGPVRVAPERQGVEEDERIALSVLRQRLSQPSPDGTHEAEVPSKSGDDEDDDEVGPD